MFSRLTIANPTTNTATIHIVSIVVCRFTFEAGHSKVSNMKKYEHITDAEQRSIERGLDGGLSIRAIGRRLGRSPNVISEEIRRNSVNGVYVARKAKHKARVRRKQSKVQCLKVAMDAELKDYVTREIMDEQSPQGISERLKHVEKDKPYASTKAIYKFVHSVHGRKIEKHLYSKRIKRKGGAKRKRPVILDGRTMIDKRPKSVLKRLQFGHFEGDFIESGKDGHGSLLVLVERKTRYSFLLYTEDRKTEHINNLIAYTLRDVPVKSITLDNDLSFQKHEELSNLLEIIVFFTHPFTSQEKGTVENRNKSIRQHIPKKTDLSQIPQREFKRIEEWLRTRFMVCLKGKTAQEAWDIEIEKIKKNAKTKKITPERVIKN
jgi:transposase, IS30 family